ncbi:32084_t:CDS:2, partial [Racocetra persica]
DGVIKHIIHEHHRHKREEYLNAKKGSQWVDALKRRKHAISRRIELRNFLQNYVNKATVSHQKRKGVIDYERPAENTKRLFNTPDWTKAGYNGILKNQIKRYTSESKLRNSKDSKKTKSDK